MQPSHTIIRPTVHSSAVIFGSPHSGRLYPRRFMARSLLDSIEIRSSEDAYVDEFLEGIETTGAYAIMGAYPRAFVDLNRSAKDLDPALISGAPRGALNPRVIAGLGVIPRIVAHNRVIQRGKMTLEEANERLELAWHPYHKDLSNLMAKTQNTHGEAILLDLHSMPSMALSKIEHAPDIVIGDRFGTSADQGLTKQVQVILADHGFSTSLNVPFAGAYISQKYGRPHKNSHVIQLEINRALYLDEETVERSGNFLAFKKRLRTALADLSKISTQLHKPKVAAE